MEKEKICSRVVEKLIKNGADDATVSLYNQETSQLKFSNSRINALKTWESSDIGVFASFKKKIVFTNIKEFSERAVDDVIKKIVKFMDFASPKEDYYGIAEGPFRYRKIQDSYDPKIVGLGDKAVDIVQSAINKADSSGAKRCAGVFSFSKSSVFLTTSNNVSANDKATKAYFSIRSFADKNASGQQAGFSRMLKYIKPENMAEESAKIAKMALKPAEGKPGNFNIVFDELPFSNFIENLGEAMSAFSVDAGMSCLKGMIGKDVAAKALTINDNGMLSNGYNSQMFDAEGVPSRNTCVIKDGKLKTYLHNTSTARKFNVKTTANAGILYPEATNLVVGKGDFSKQELFEQAKNGLYITNTWYTRFQNYQTGDFSTIPKDGIFRIENGQISRPVKDIRISENLIGMMKRVSALGKQRKRIIGWGDVERPVVAPPAMIEGVRVTRPR